MPAYATAAQFAAAGYSSTLAGAELDAELERASRDIDRVMGPSGRYGSGPWAGFKFDPSTLAGWEAEALARATAAQANHRLLTRRDGASSAPLKSLKGPDFEEVYADAAASGTGRYAPDLAAELEPIAHLRTRYARARA